MKKLILFFGLAAAIASAQQVQVPASGAPITPLLTSANETVGNSCSNYTNPRLNWMTGLFTGCINGKIQQLAPALNVANTFTADQTFNNLSLNGNYLGFNNSAGAYLSASNVNGALYFQTGGSIQQAMITKTGNVLIGTTTDDGTDKLQVNGSISATTLGSPANLALNAAGSIFMNKTIASYNGVSTVANGIPAIVAKADATAQSANIGATTLYAVPAGGAGMYRASCYVVFTQAATTSSTLPNCTVSWKDSDSATTRAVNVTPTLANNTVGITSAEATNAPALLTVNAAASSTIQYSTANYASSGATPMQYAVHVRLEFLGQ